MRQRETAAIAEESVLRGRSRLFGEPKPQAVGIGSASGLKQRRVALVAGARDCKPNSVYDLSPYGPLLVLRLTSHELQRSTRETRNQPETERDVGPALFTGAHLLERKRRPHERVR
jgi:hypothetical protein